MRDFDLTHREKDILELLALGKSNDQISKKLDISINTVKTHLKHIFRKMQVENRTAAARAFIEHH